MSTRARQHRVGLLALPDELLSAVLSCGDLRARFTCVAAASLLRDAQERMSPAHEHKLLIQRFPILKPLLLANSTLAPADVFRSQLFHSRIPKPMTPTVNMDEYTFHVEVELVRRKTDRRKTETIYVGTGTLGAVDDSYPSAAVSFQIPQGVWSKASDAVVNQNNYYNEDIKISVMASRARGGVVECARVYQGIIEEIEAKKNFFFYPQPIPCSPALTRLKTRVHHGIDMISYAVYLADRETLFLCLQFDDDTDMDVDEAKSMLDFFNWAPACRVVQVK